jgi:hypothetical protein
MTENKFKFPTEMVDLPSKGLLYPEGHPLSKGKIEMKYMTAREEDILTNQNYIKQGIVIDKLLQSLIVTKFDFDDLLIGDKNAIMIAARVLGYGKDYSFTYEGEEITVDLSELATVELDESTIEKGVNSFNYTLPHSGTIEDEVKGLKKLNKNGSPDLSTRLKHQILSVEGDDNKKVIRDFVDNYFLARDSASFRAHLKTINPDVKMVFNHVTDNGEEEVSIPLQVQFFWPDA